MGEAAEVLWQPNPGPQTRALSSPVFELGYGGGAGGGKSDFLLVCPLRWHHLKGFHGVLFRRTFKELEDGLIPRSWELYRPLGGDYNEGKHRWTWYDKAGNPHSRISLSHLQHEKDVFDHKSAQYQYAGFDELTSFTQFQYVYMFSRLRSAQGIPSRLRSSFNPEPGWVRDRFAPWVRTADEYKGPRVPDGAVLYFTRKGETETIVPAGTPKATARTFIAARLEDNPHLYENDPEYMDRLAQLDPVQYARLRENDWESDYAAGLMFQRAWFPLVDAIPLDVRRCRFWDRAATEVKLETRAALAPQAVNDPDWSAGVLHARAKSGRHFIEDVVRMRGKPGDVQDRIVRTAEDDEQKYGRHGFTIVLEQEPGASGEAEIAHYMKLLARWHVVPVRHSANKILRAGPVSGQAKAGNVSVLRASWNGEYFAELEAFPKGKHDDQVDGTSGGYNYLASAPTTEGASIRGGRRAVNSGGF